MPEKYLQTKLISYGCVGFIVWSNILVLIVKLCLNWLRIDATLYGDFPQQLYIDFNQVHVDIVKLLIEKDMTLI